MTALGLGPDRERLAASLLYQVILAGGATPDQALRDVRRGAGIGAPVTAGIDILFNNAAFQMIKQDIFELSEYVVASSPPVEW